MCLLFYIFYERFYPFTRMQTLKPRTGGLIVINKQIMRSTSAASVKTANCEGTKNLKSWQEIPGPPSLPLVGPIFSFLPGGRFAGLKVAQLYEQLYKTYGPIVRLEGIAGSPNLIWLFDADSIAVVHRSENATPIRFGFPSLEYYRKRYNKIYDPKRQTGLITDHGENWRDFRSKVNHIMLQPKTIKLYSEVLADVANDTITRIRSIRDENNMIKDKFDIEMNLWALESIGVVALGARLNCLDPNLPGDSEARKLIQSVHDFFEVGEKLDFGVSFWRYFSTPTFRKGMKIFEEQESLTKFFIDKAMNNLEQSKSRNMSVSDSEKPILEKLLEIDPQVALIMASDMLIAGVDTAANTAIATLYLLAKNPEKQSKLREEVQTKQAQGPYLRACIKESMRMMPVVSGGVRLTTKEYNLLGYKIPKDMNMIFAHQFLSTWEEHYPRANEFIPERWLVKKTDPLYHGNTNPFVYNPFGYGSRMCIGLRIAELEMQTFVSKAVQNFQIEWDGAPPNVNATSLNYITGPFHFIFKDL